MVTISQCGQGLQFRSRHVIVIGALEIDLKEAVKLHYLTLGYEVFLTSSDGDVCRRLLEFGISHLRCYRALPDQVIEFFLLRSASDGMVADIGGADGLVSLLGTLAAGAVLSHLEILLTDSLLHLLADGIQRQFAQVHRVGTHIGDETFLIESLCQPHGLLDRESKLAGSFLLQCAGGKGRRR